jgi:hypothetical protein
MTFIGCAPGSGLRFNWFTITRSTFSVIPAQAGIQTTTFLESTFKLSLIREGGVFRCDVAVGYSWIPACAGMTRFFVKK